MICCPAPGRPPPDNKSQAIYVSTYPLLTFRFTPFFLFNACYRYPSVGWTWYCSHDASLVCRILICIRNVPGIVCVNLIIWCKHCVARWVMSNVAFVMNWVFIHFILDFGFWSNDFAWCTTLILISLIISYYLNRVMQLIEWYFF